MNDSTYDQWVREGRRVAAKYAAGDGVHAVGRVISYTDRPTVTIVTDRGERISWIADLCKPDPETESAKAWRDLEEVVGYNVGSTSTQDSIRDLVRTIERAAKAEREMPHCAELGCVRYDGHSGAHSSNLTFTPFDAGNL